MPPISLLSTSTAQLRLSRTHPHQTCSGGIYARVYKRTCANSCKPLSHPHTITMSMRLSWPNTTTPQGRSSMLSNLRPIQVCLCVMHCSRSSPRNKVKQRACTLPLHPAADVAGLSVSCKARADILAQGSGSCTRGRPSDCTKQPLPGTDIAVLCSVQWASNLRLPMELKIMPTPSLQIYFKCFTANFCVWTCYGMMHFEVHNVFCCFIGAT